MSTAATHKTMSATEARRHFLLIIEDVRKGGTYTITRYGKIAAKIEPVVPAPVPPSGTVVNL